MRASRERGRMIAGSLVWLVAGWCGVAVAAPPIDFPALPGYELVVCDLHMHTVFSDGLVWPTVRVDEARREGIDVIAITDHIEYQPHKGDVPTNHNRPYEIAAESAARQNVLLIRGTEVTRDTPPGHYNAVFLTDINPLDTPEFYDVFDAAAQQHAFVFWNHPDWQGLKKGEWSDYQQTLLDKGQLQGIEVCNGSAHYKQAHGYALAHNLTLIGNSDIHEPSLSQPITPDEHRTLTLVFARERSLPAVREALDARRTVVWWKNHLVGRPAELTALFPRCLEVRPPHRMSDKHLWAELVNHTELDFELTANGKHHPRTIKVPAESVRVVRFDRSTAGDEAGLAYNVTNFITAPDETLTVTLHLPAGVTAGEGAE